MLPPTAANAAAATSAAERDAMYLVYVSGAGLSPSSAKETFRRAGGGEAGREPVGELNGLGGVDAPSDAAPSPPSPPSSLQATGATGGGAAGVELTRGTARFMTLLSMRSAPLPCCPSIMLLMAASTALGGTRPAAVQVIVGDAGGSATVSLSPA